MIAQLSDTHLVGHGLVHGSVDPYRQLATALEELEGSAMAPDALLLSGDLADAGDPVAYERLRELVDPVAQRLDAAVLYMPGNHDDRQAFRRVLLDGQGEGPLDQVLWLGGLRLVALDSCVPGRHHGELDPAQLSCLAETLATPAPEGTVLAVHHQPIRSPVKIADLLCLRRPQQLAEVIAGTDVLLLVCGHTHHPGSGSLGGVPVWVSTSTAYQADVLADEHLMRSLPGSAFSRIDLADGSAVATHVPVRAGAAAVGETDITGVEEQLRRLS